jgi:uncharacterized protein DUF6093
MTEPLINGGRAAAERLMVDTCTITRSSVAFTDPETGHQVKTTTTVYAGKCRIQMQMPGSANASEPGEAYLLMLNLSVQVPASVTGVQPGDIVTVTAAAHDPELVGRTFRVKDLAHKTHATSRRLGVQEVT